MSYPRVVLGLPWWIEELIPDPAAVLEEYAGCRGMIYDARHGE
jgi:hypothetical protein